MARNERRKEQRPEEILEAAIEEFAVRGYAQTRLEDVASRAGISKGLVYVYFRTKEELFKAAIRTLLVPRVEALRKQLESSDETSEALIRGPVLSLMKQVVGSRLGYVVRLMVAEGAKHPDLTAFYHEQMISRTMGLLRWIIARGVERGEFKPSPVMDFPQLFVAPVLISLLWKMLIDRHQHLDAEKMLEAHIDIMLGALKRDPALTPDTL
ncbi:TetR/AcrR family transcriptional regulator [Leptospira interrogans]